MGTLMDTIAADLAHLVDPDSGFGEAFVKADASTINGIMQDGFEDSDDPRAPLAIFRTIDLAALSHGAQLTRQVDSVVYTIEGGRPERSGFTTVRLSQL